MKVNSLLTKRLKAPTDNTKMRELSQRSSSGSLSTFSGVFQVSEISDEERKKLKKLLKEFATDDVLSLEEDLSNLSAVTSEVKAINNQAAILHGERIKKAQTILKNYRDGAFSSWLIAAYGNRQTPYNFLQYYELHSALPHMLLPKLEEMPRQALYTLASRSGSQEKKEEIIRNYKGETKDELLMQIREAFPLSAKDRRKQDPVEVAILTLKKLDGFLSRSSLHPTKSQKTAIKELLGAIKGRLS